MAEEKPLIVLFDGNSLVHRAFHALPPLTVSKTGEPMGGVYGFARMLLKVLAELKPSHCAIAFDRPTPTFRHIQFKEYKAQRPKAPDELISQLHRVRELAVAFSIPIFEMDGYEADDVLGTLCRQSSAQGIDTIIVTGDTDAMQLVSPKVRVLMPGRTFGEATLYDEAAVYRRYGVAPEQITDLKGLKGDPSDNIPGVLGIGEKTAVKLIQEFHSVEGIYEQIDKVTPDKIRDALLSKAELAKESKELVTIVTDVPITLNLSDCRVGEYDRDEVRKFFYELEFFSLMDKLSQAKVAGQEEGYYHLVATPEDLDQLITRLSSSQSVAISLDVARPRCPELVGMALSPAAGSAYYVPLEHRALNRLKPLVENPKIAKIAHDGKLDIMLLLEHGIKLRNLAFDTMIGAYLLGEKALKLESLAFGKLGVEMAPSAAIEGFGGDVSSSVQWACARADIVGRLRDVLEKELEKHGMWKLSTQVEMPLIPVLAQMERNGVALDVSILRDMSLGLAKQLLELESRIYGDIGHRFNINSPQQLGFVLFEELRLPHGRRTKTGYSTDASVLEGLREAHPAVGEILEYRQLKKLRSTYIDALPTLVNPKTGRLHTSFNQVATATGRLSSSEPNLQNIPVRGEWGKRIRQAFIAEGDSFLLSADYSQIELRVLAHLSQDAGLLAAFRADDDIHTATASEVFGVPKEQITPDMRRAAKTVNFGVIYGMSNYGLEQATGLSRGEASQFISSYFERYPGVKQYIDSTKKSARERGYVQTLLGHRRYLPELNSTNQQVRGAAERMAVNMPVQGTAAEVIKLAMVKLQKEMEEQELRSKMILQVHDELLFEVVPDELEEMRNLARRLMCEAMELSVPLKVDIKVGRNWGEIG